MLNTSHWFKARIHDIDVQEALELLGSHQVGRIVFTDDQGPAVVPVNYALDGKDILIATSAYGSVARWATDRRVAFEVDDIDSANECGWSVIVSGHAQQAEYLDLPPDPSGRPYPWAEGARTFILRIQGDTITGRRLIPV